MTIYVAIHDSSEDLVLDQVFREPPRPPSPDPSWQVYVRDTHAAYRDKDNDSNDEGVLSSESWSEIKIKLVGTHPLWGHFLWNAARAVASYLDLHPHLYRGRHVLELGAGGGLPGILTAKNGAGRVVLTDYPDSNLLQNLKQNVLHNIGPEVQDRVSVLGYIWGRSVQPLLEPLTREGPYSEMGFDLIILSDLVFNHSQHDALLTTCESVLNRVSGEESATTMQADNTPSVLVFYTHHRPHLAERDLEFFALGRQRGWICEEILQQRYPPMFPNDPGEEDIRSTVHGWRLRLTQTSSR